MLLGELHESKKKAVCYYRHSAEDKQENSVEIQRDHAMRFAAEHGIEIIHEEADEGVSGLIENRPAFQRLFQDWILNKEAQTFDYVLVYDTTRWGRFQDLDKGGSLEHLCREHGKQVVYITRGFPKDGLTHHLLGSIERYMSADYSRQLSGKVFYGSVKVSEQGYSAGGTAAYGMSRILLDENKQPVGKLKKGQHKVIANQRVTFTPAEDDSTETVKRIFHDLVFRWMELDEIAFKLNEEKVSAPAGGSWDKTKILRVLTNETYTGTRIYNKTWNRLKQGHRQNPQEDWIFCYNAFPAVVDPDIFKEAQERLYYLMPQKRNLGRRLRRRIKDTVKQELMTSYLQQNYEQDLAFALTHQFPMTSSVAFYQKETNHAKWIFRIPEDVRRFDQVVALGVSLNTKSPMRDVFVFPTEIFDEENFLIVTEGDELYARHVVLRDRIKERVADISRQMKDTFVLTD